MKGHTHKIANQFWQWLIVITVFVLPVCVWGQSVDSLENVLATQQLTDEEKIKLLDDLSWLYNSVDIQKSIAYGKAGLALAQRNQDNRMEALFYKNIGISYYMGGILDTALQYLDKARPLIKQLGEYRQEGSLHNAYANIYRVQSLYDLAIENYLQSAKLLETNNDIQGIILIYSNIGGVYQIMQNYEQALKYFKKSEKLALETNDQEGLASIYISLSDIGLYQHAPKEESVDYARKAIEIFQKTNNLYAQNKALQTLAKVYYYHDDYTTAEPIATQAIKQAKALGFPHLIAEALNIMSNIHLYQGKYAESVGVSMESLKTDSTDVNIIRNSYSNLAVAHAHLNNPDSTYAYMLRYEEAINRYTNESYQNSLSGMEVRHETEKKELKIAALEKQRQLYIWLGIASALILLIALAFAFIRYRLAVSRRKLAEEETQRLEQEKQLVAIQATLDGEAAERTRLAKDLHDGLGSMLSAVKINLPQMQGEAAVMETIDVSRFQKAIDMLDDSIQELRRVAHHMMPQSLLRYGLKASLTDFCTAVPTADFHYFGDESRLSEKMEIMVYRCIHELVNNALKHAQAQHINVQLVQEADRVSFTVQDDGVGFDQENVTEGMGLQNVRQRIMAFGGKINIYSSEQGTEVHVEIEYND